MFNVKKESGEQEEYSEDKIRNSIKKALVDAGESVEEKKELIEKTVKDVTESAKKTGEVTTKEIKEKVLSALDEAGSKASSAWTRFDQRYKQ